ncbi:hypothetical protein TELCIR_16799 [Teladorsagia circumcincta]|uniref:Amiloride-sensitive sodium channel n=1 Tax=Teladorsagia circumcincta TaxID=45464 RepID=A0A2G9TWN8_TELCI|nr:hypothetical protein TELCIR_16799 [Teladorsagia circumcincta]
MQTFEKETIRERCEEFKFRFVFFNSWWAGSRIVDCCDIFKPTYVMLRGRCFRLTDDYNQTDVDENDKLSIYINNVQKGILAGKKNMCLPACERVENQMQMTTKRDYTRNPDYSFRVETSFTDLQYEKYEKYSEIRLTTSAGFISELGGQSGFKPNAETAKRWLGEGEKKKKLERMFGMARGLLGFTALERLH